MAHIFYDGVPLYYGVYWLFHARTVQVFEKFGERAQGVSVFSLGRFIFLFPPSFPVAPGPPRALHVGERRGTYLRKWAPESARGGFFAKIPPDCRHWGLPSPGQALEEHGQKREPATRAEAELRGEQQENGQRVEDYPGTGDSSVYRWVW